jgi:hypothetical protein
MGASRKLILAITAVAGFGCVGTADAATVTYTSSDPPQSVAEGGQAASSVTVPQGRTDAADIDVVGIQLLAASNSADQQLTLINPYGFQRLIVNLGCTSYPAGTNFNLDQDAAGNPFGGAGTCPPGTGTYKPSTSPQSGTPLADIGISPSSGRWGLNYHDTNVSGSGGTLNGWGLRITHEPLGCILRSENDEQQLKKPLLISAVCNAYYSLITGGDAKRVTLTVSDSHAHLVSAPLTKKARKRLRKKGKAKVALTVDDGYGDVISQTLKVKLKRK